MRVWVLYQEEAFAKRLRRCSGRVEEMTFLSSTLEIESRLKMKQKIDLLVIETSMLCNDSLVNFGDMVKGKIPGIKIAYLSDYILPYVKRRVFENNHYYFDKSVKFSELLEKTLNDEPETSEISNFELTRSERQVLKLIAQGLKQVDVAKELYISPRTVNNHLSSIYEKLNVNSTISAVVKGVQEGLVWIDYGISPKR